MSPIDLPPPQYNPKAESQILAVKEAKDSFFQDLLDATPRSKDNVKMEITDIGQVQRMVLTDQWTVPAHQPEVPAGSGFHEYFVKDRPEVKICFYYRGRRTSERSGEAFRGVLQKPPHVLLASEIDALAETLRNKDDKSVFSLLNARTEDINGKRILIVEGRYIAKQYDTQALYIDSDGTGTAVQEVYYQAPKQEYAIFLKQAREAIKSIQWK